MAGYICSQISSYRANSGYCGLTGGYENCQRRLLYQSGSGAVIRKTNADRLRAMTDEELAGVLAMQGVVSPPWCSENYDCPYADQDPVRCDLCALDWLKEEAAE